MSTVLVTGATGLLGSCLARRLLAEGFGVRILRRATSRLDLLGDAAGRVEHAVGDVTDPLAVGDAMQGVERVFHAAAYVGPGARERLMLVNVDGTAAVVDAALKHDVHRLLHVSSMAAFGRPERPDSVIDEDAEWQRSKANSAYATSKYLAELEVRRGIAEGLDAVIINPALIFGVGRPGDNTRRIVDRVRDERLPAVPSGSTNVVDVLDVVDGALLAMESGDTGERYFLGSENLSWKAIVERLADALAVASPRITLKAKPAMVLACAVEALVFLTRSEPLITRETARTASQSYRYSSEKAREALGWEPRPFQVTAERIARELGASPAA